MKPQSFCLYFFLAMLAGLFFSNCSTESNIVQPNPDSNPVWPKPDTNAVWPEPDPNAVWPKPLAVGMQWEDSVDLDSSFYGIDTLGAVTEIPDIHRRITRRNHISMEVPIQGANYLWIRSFDSVFFDSGLLDSILVIASYFSQTGTGQYQAVPFSHQFYSEAIPDTLVLQTMPFPLELGASWTFNSITDTAVLLQRFILSDSVRVVREAGVTGTVLVDTSFSFNSTSYFCKLVRLESHDNLYGLDNRREEQTPAGIIVTWDTVSFVKVSEDSYRFYANEFSRPLYSHTERTTETRNLGQFYASTIETHVRRSWLKIYKEP
jgi:hypothetical protein